MATTGSKVIDRIIREVFELGDKHIEEGTPLRVGLMTIYWHYDIECQGWYSDITFGNGDEGLDHDLQYDVKIELNSLDAEVIGKPMTLDVYTIPREDFYSGSRMWREIDITPDGYTMMEVMIRGSFNQWTADQIVKIALICMEESYAGVNKEALEQFERLVNTSLVRPY